MSIVKSFTIKLLKVIGSPFISEDTELPKDNEEALELYYYSIKNKIGFTYLESINNRGKLEELGLKSYHQDEKIRHEKQLVTINRISHLLNMSAIDYAIFKSIMPFSVIPNDVDIIHFGTYKEYQRTIELMTKSDYIEVKGDVDTEQCMFHDAMHGGHLTTHPNKKDVYDIDIYQKISASHIIYLDKAKIKKYVSNMNTIKVLSDDAELIVIIIHSIIPEMIFTLSAYYSTLHHIKRMSMEDIMKFIDVSKENYVTSSVKAHCTLTALLHKEVHGFVPEKIEYILDKLGIEKREKKILVKNDFRMPHRYSLSIVSRVLFEKLNEREFRRSVVRQMIYMLNPRLTKWVVYNIIWRRKRLTY